MAKIIALWGPPRSTGTAFEWMMRQRGDMKCFHEPFGHAWHQGESPLWPRFNRGDPSIKGLTATSVMNALALQSKNAALFIKDSPHHCGHDWSPNSVNLFTHTFLIRNPAKTLMSLYRTTPDVNELEIGVPEHRTLFETVMASTGQVPFVMDANDMLDDPEPMISKWCDHVGISFDQTALNWPRAAHSDTLWRTDRTYHETLTASDGLAHQACDRGDLNDLPDHMKAIYLRIKPHYDYLHTYRIRM